MYILFTAFIQGFSGQVNDLCTVILANSIWSLSSENFSVARGRRQEAGWLLLCVLLIASADNADDVRINHGGINLNSLSIDS